MSIVRAISDTGRKLARLGETVAKETWSKLDAAAEKPRPNEYLRPRAIRAIQGQTDVSK